MAERNLKNRIPTSAVAAGLVLLVSGGAVIVNDWQTEHELSRMPEDTRRALYEKLNETLSSSCLHVTGDEFRDYCRGQAEFLARFPECGEACQGLCRRYVPRATK